MHSTASTLIICPGALVFSAVSASGVTKADRKDDYPYISMATAGALTRIIDIFVKSGTTYIVQPTSSTTLQDMQEHPVILIVAYNNKWTLLLLNDLRFRFADEPARRIYDTTTPSASWARPEDLPYQNEDDFAIVAR